MGILEWQPPKKNEFSKEKLNKFIEQIAYPAALELVERHFPKHGPAKVQAKEKLIVILTELLNKDNQQLAGELFGPIDQAVEKLIAIGEQKFLKKERIEIKK